jgi:protein tyrosine phosphatase (PTP) superfamily phosphohydrolase (DUF442 family)
MPRRMALAALVLLAAICSVALVAPGPVHTFLFEDNLHTVVPGQIYRSAQPSAADLEALIRRLHLRSVLNLRGDAEEKRWYRAERRVSATTGVRLFTVHLSAKTLPPAQRLREVLDVLETAPRPLLLHCKGGVERSGLVAALAVLLDGGDLDAARAQFAASKGFLLPTTDLPDVLDEYQRWLASRGVTSTPARVQRWVQRDYAPGYYRAEIEALDAPRVVTRGQAPVLHFRVTNRSTRPIPFSSDPLAATSLGAFLRAPGPGDPPPVEMRGRHVDLSLEPGASVELALPLPHLDRPGAWRLHVDLVDQVKWFAWMGSTPLDLEIQVPAGPADAVASLSPRDDR